MKNLVIAVLIIMVLVLYQNKGIIEDTLSIMDRDITLLHEINNTLKDKLQVSEEELNSCRDKYVSDIPVKGATAMCVGDLLSCINVLRQCDAKVNKLGGK
jgi:signal transduction histidine kinase